MVTHYCPTIRVAGIEKVTQKIHASGIAKTTVKHLIPNLSMFIGCHFKCKITTAPTRSYAKTFSALNATGLSKRCAVLSPIIELEQRWEYTSEHSMFFKPKLRLQHMSINLVHLRDEGLQFYEQNPRLFELLVFSLWKNLGFRHG